MATIMPLLVSVFALVAVCPSAVSVSFCHMDVSLLNVVKRYGDFCYEFVEGTTADWYFAEDYCRQHNGNLTDFASLEDFIVIDMSILNQKLWIGLTDEQSEGTWSWTSGRPLSFERWELGQPSMNNTGNCAAALARTWFVHPCNDTFFGWICKYDMPKHDLCPDNLNTSRLVQYRNVCYEFILETPEEWSVAFDDCASKSGNLADIHSHEEYSYIVKGIQLLMHEMLQMPQGGRHVWIGLTDQNDEGNWTWMSGKALEFEDWAIGEPEINNEEHCVVWEFHANGGLNCLPNGWHSYPCQGPKFGWICKYDIKEQ